MKSFRLGAERTPSFPLCIISPSRSPSSARWRSPATLPLYPIPSMRSFGQKKSSSFYSSRVILCLLPEIPRSPPLWFSLLDYLFLYFWWHARLPAPPVSAPMFSTWSVLPSLFSPSILIITVCRFPYDPCPFQRPVGQKMVSFNSL